MQPPPVENNNNIIHEVVEVEPQQRILDIEYMIRKLDDEYIQELLPKQLALQNAITYLQQQEQELLQQQQQQRQAGNNTNEESNIGSPTATTTTATTTINMSLTKETIQNRQHSNKASAPTAATRKRQLGLPKQHQQEMAAARLAQALFQMDSTDDDDEEEEDDDSSKSNDSI